MHKLVWCAILRESVCVCVFFLLSLLMPKYLGFSLSPPPFFIFISVLVARQCANDDLGKVKLCCKSYTGLVSMRNCLGG